MNSKNLAFSGGGTGGHIYPNLAVIENIHHQYPEHRLFYFGSPQKLEAKLLNSEELKDYRNELFKNYLEFIAVDSEPLPKNIFKIFSWIKNFKRFENQAKKSLQEQKIDVVFGTGGYGAGPVFAAAAQLKIPYIIHNLDAHMGLANRAFVRDATALTLGVCDLGIKPKNGQVILTGNPVSKRFSEQLTGNRNKNSKLNLLITGGSQGAKDLNEAIGNNLDALCKLELSIIHVTGQKLYEDYIKKYGGNRANYTVLPYTHNMPELCQQADLAVCRSGAMTIAEMSLSEVVCIYIPLPWAAHNHQFKNAEALVKSGAALCLDQQDRGFSKKLFQEIENFCSNKTRLITYRNNLTAISKNDALKAITELVIDSSAAQEKASA